jgi:hypothetical protein
MVTVCAAAVATDLTVESMDYVDMAEKNRRRMVFGMGYTLICVISLFSLGLVL